VRSYPVWHYVTFADSIDRASIEELRRDILTAAASGTLAVGCVLIAARSAGEVYDGKLHGRIHIGQPIGSTALAVGFKSAAELSSYYAAPAHAEIRRRYYARFSPEIAELYGCADCDPQTAAAAYEAIERIAARFMRRDDFIMTQDGE
jgi:hypothetical protein